MLGETASGLPGQLQHASPGETSRGGLLARPPLQPLEAEAGHLGLAGRQHEHAGAKGWGERLLTAAQQLGLQAGLLEHRWPSQPMLQKGQDLFWLAAGQPASRNRKQGGLGAGAGRQDLAQPLPGLPQLAEGTVRTASRQAPQQGTPGGRWRVAAVPEQVVPAPLQHPLGGIDRQGFGPSAIGHRHHSIHPQGLAQQVAAGLAGPLNPDPGALECGVMAAGGPAAQGRTGCRRVFKGQAVEGGAGPQPGAAAGGELHQLVVVANVEGGQARIERPLTSKHFVQVFFNKRLEIAAVGQLQQQGIEAAVGEGGGKAGRQQQGSRQQIKVEVGPIQAGMAAGQQGAQQRRRIGLLAQQAEQVEGARQIICGQSLA